jgi:glutaredoxin-related protein
MYLLFYSEKCRYSQKFIEILHEIGDEKFFKFVNVAKVNKKYPPIVKKYNIKEVPTILVDSELLVGVDAFKWLENKIKNINHQISSQNTRMNKTPVIGGYSEDISSCSVGGEIPVAIGTNSFASIFSSQKIETPNEDEEYQKSSFVLPSDNITNGQSGTKDDRPDRTSKMESDYERLLKEREMSNKPKLNKY